MVVTPAWRATSASVLRRACCWSLEWLTPGFSAAKACARTEETIRKTPEKSTAQRGSKAAAYYELARVYQDDKEPATT
jgi:hypothetical protein